MAVSIDTGLFNFTQHGYTPPVWSGDTYNFVFASQLYQIYTDANYVYASTAEGLDIYDIESEQKYAYITYNSGFRAVWGNDDYVFVGTTSSGIKYLSKTCISGSISSPYNLYTCLAEYKDYPNITSSYVRYLHGNGNYLLCCTNAGVDMWKLEPQSYRSYTTVSGAYKCFMTSSGKFYYTLDTHGTWSVNRVNSCLWDWVLQDYSYVAGTNIFREGITVNDIFITEETSSDGISNTVFSATSSGVYIIDEGTLEYAIYYTV